MGVTLNMKKILTLMIMCLFILTFSVHSISALDWDNVKYSWLDHPEMEENTITIKNAFGLPFIGDNLATYKLTYNTDQCIIDCYAEGIATLYTYGYLFTNLNFKDVRGKNTVIKSNNILIKVNETYKIEVNDYGEEECKLNVNGTLVCTKPLIGSHIEQRGKWVWREYKGEILNAGNYTWKIEGKKNIWESVDWIGSSFGEDFTEWAWWDSNWRKKREIKIQDNAGSSINNYTIDLTISYDDDMNVDYSDIRFLNGSENTELGYWIYFANASEARVRVRIEDNLIANKNLSIYMYYDNSGASTTSDIANAHIVGEDGADFSEWTEIDSNSVITLDTTDKRVEFTNLPRTNTHSVRRTFSPLQNFSLTAVFDKTAQASGGHLHFGVADSNINYITQTSSGIYFISVGGSTNHYVRQWYNGVDDTTADTITDTELNNIRYVKLNKYGTNTNLTIFDDQARQTIHDTALNTDYGNATEQFNRAIMITQNDQAAPSATFSGWITNYTISKYIYPEPTYTIGAEEIGNLLSVTLNSPINYYNSSVSDVTFNCSATDETGVLNLTLILDGSDNYTITNSTENVNLSLEVVRSFNDGSYNWTCRASDGTGQGDPVTTTTKYFIIDTTEPNITATENITNLVTQSFPVSSNWRFNVTDEHLSDCWYYSSDNSTNTTITCNTTIQTDWLSEGAKTLYYCANDTFNHQTCGSSNLIVYQYSSTQTESSDPIGEGDSVIYVLWLNMTNIDSDWLETNATLRLNNTDYSPSKYSGTDYLKFVYTHIFSNVSGSVSGAIHYWNWTYNIQNSSYILGSETTSTSNTTVYKVAIDDCGSYETKILDYTLFDEEYKSNTNPTALANQSIEIDVTMTKGNYIWEYSKTENGTNVADICLPNGLLNSSNYTLGVVTRYKADNHVVEFNYITNAILSNSGNPRNISLYDLYSQTDRAEYSTSFLVNYQDENYLPVEDAIIDLWRYYVGDGEFLSVEHGKTDADGNTRLHFVTEDVRYKAFVRVDGVIEYSSPEFLALCQATPCQINLQKESGVSSVGNYSQVENLAYSITLDKSTKTVTLTFATVDGSSANMQMNVTNWDAYINDTVCSDSSVSSGGTLSCTVPTSAKNTTYLVQIWKESESLPTYVFDLNPDAFDTFGYTGVILTAIIYLTLVLMAVSSGGIAVLIFGIIGLIFAGMLTLFSGGSVIGVGSSLMWLIVAIIIVAIKISNRRSG